MKPEELKGYVVAEASVSKAKLLRDMQKRGHRKDEVEEAISRLLSSGELVERRSGKSVSYSLPYPDVASAIQKLLEGQERILSALGSSDETFEASFDKFYRKVRDVAGIATLRDIRSAMNMEASDFYSSFQKIYRKYRLSPGGDEGLIIDGNVWGVILGYA
ncbi:hypothetical protein PQ610_05980 [Tardisphaera miroshnichenkoae]